MRELATLLTVVVGMIVVGCGESTGSDSRSGSPTTSPIALSTSWPPNCLVRLHGKGGEGEPARVVGDVTELAPTGNADGWGARQWVYESDEQLATAKAAITESLDTAGCTRVVVNGFSNGGAFAAALYCAAERFDGRVVGYVIDDPVPDGAVLGCNPDPEVEVVLYWTGALDDAATPGADCDDLDWTCAGGSLLGIKRYSTELDVTATRSPFDEHRWYRDAPEASIWLNG